MSTPAEIGSPRKGRNAVIAAAAVLVILASAVWIYLTEFAGSELNLPLHQTVGRRMAAETARIVGRSGKIVLVSVDVPGAPELKVQVGAFEKQLKTLGGITIADKIMMNPGENPKYRAGSGLSAKHLLKIIHKHPGADAIVSFIGAPPLSDSELQQCKTAPKIIAETHSPEKLLNLLDKKVLQAAVVPRFEFPAPGPRKPHTGLEWFDRYFQVIGPGTAVPAEDATP